MTVLIGCIRKLLFTWLIVAMVAHGWADDRWTIDGIWLGAAQDQVKQPLTPHQRYKNLLTWQGEPMMAYGQPAILVHIPILKSSVLIGRLVTRLYQGLCGQYLRELV